MPAQARVQTHHNPINHREKNRPLPIISIPKSEEKHHIQFNWGTSFLDGPTTAGEDPAWPPLLPPLPSPTHRPSASISRPIRRPGSLSPQISSRAAPKRSGSSARNSPRLRPSRRSSLACRLVLSVAHRVLSRMCRKRKDTKIHEGFETCRFMLLIFCFKKVVLLKLSWESVTGKHVYVRIWFQRQMHLRMVLLKKIG